MEKPKMPYVLVQFVDNKVWCRNMYGRGEMSVEFTEKEFRILEDGKLSAEFHRANIKQVVFQDKPFSAFE